MTDKDLLRCVILSIDNGTGVLPINQILQTILNQMMRYEIPSTGEAMHFIMANILRMKYSLYLKIAG